MAKKLLCKGCQAYLVHVVGTIAIRPKKEDIPIMKEFSEIFHEDLSGLPPDWEIKFVIDLLQGTTPICIMLYRMPPAKIRELKVQ